MRQQRGGAGVNGTATLTPGASVSGAGNFAVTSGTITNNGTFNVGGTNTFSGGTAVLAGSCTMTNNPLIVSGGALILNGIGTVAPSSLTFSAGTLSGGVPVTVSGLATWSAGPCAAG